ncbi:DUF6777 domain-containing protein [Streptomyces hypolithicus]
MSAQPPSGRPTGPPSGPLSGPTQQGPTPPPDTPSGPPSGPPSGGGPGDPGGPGGPGGPSGTKGPGGTGGRPWWRSVPTVAAIAAALVAAVVVTVVLTRPDKESTGSTASGEVFLQPAGSSGPAPYTESTARKAGAATSPTPQPNASASGSNATRAVRGSDPGLYGGTRKVASCDVEQQIQVLTSQQTKTGAFAGVLDIEPSGVPEYLRSLTPVQLRMDTRVTNHGYENGAATSYQAVLQTGTAVLVDDRGVPRVRCACGNPLRPPVALQGAPRRTGTSWPAYRPSQVVTVVPAVQVVNVFVLFDPKSEKWFTRDSGDTGGGDETTTPPRRDPSSPSPSEDASPSAPSEPSPPDGPTSEAPSPDAPSPDSPEPDDPGTGNPPSPDPPEEAPSSDDPPAGETSLEPPRSEAPAPEPPAVSQP